MFRLCRENSLREINEEVPTYIRGLSDDSVDLITGYHIVEHLDFKDYLAFIAQCFRVFGKNGIPILESPNPDSLIVGEPAL
jgi:predicted SAM-dependent methyltransferase